MALHESLPDGWRHVALVFDGATLALWVDGALAAETEAKGEVLDADAPLRIGGGAFAGEVDEVAVWSEALSQDALAARPGCPTSPQTVARLAAWLPPEGEVVAHTSFDAAQDTPAGTSIAYQVSTDGGATWRAWDGAAWADAAGDLGAASDAATVDANLAALAPATGGLLVRGVLRSLDPAATPRLDGVSIRYGYRP